MFYIETFPVGTFQCNCSIIVNKTTSEAVIVDPGDDAGLIWERVRSLKVRITSLWHTHAHLDHLGATLQIQKLVGEQNAALPKVFLHPEDTWLYKNIKLQSQLLGLETFEVPQNFESIKNKQNYETLLDSEALHTPGHTPGSCCLHLKKKVELAISSDLNPYGYDADQVLLSGDTLFRRSIGRTDLWGGDFPKITKSIREKLFVLPEDTLVIPGHGPLTRIEEEVAKNPFID